MEFEVFTVRRQGKLLPRHVMWSTKVRGNLHVKEVHDVELSRTVRQATIEGSGATLLAGPLLDVVFVSAKPDWWTMTGWERVTSETAVAAVAYQQSWILIPADEVGPS